MKQFIVLAGSRREFEQFLDEQGLTDSEALYGYEPDVMAGVETEKVVEIGSFKERKDASKLREFADTRIRTTMERHRAWRLAEQLLEERGADPDDDLRMLARQLLRARELIQVIQPMVKGYAWEHRVGNNQKIAQWVETYLHGV